MAGGSYAGVVSAGAFAHGHLGPDVLVELIRVGRTGARYVIGVKALHYDDHGFAGAFERLAAENTISAVELRDVPIYDQRDGEHGDARALVAVFRRR